MSWGIREAVERFQHAQQARRRDVHNADLALALRAAREELDARADALRARLPFRTRKHGEHGHLLAMEDVVLREGARVRGQPLCGAPPGPLRRGSPPPCPECLLAAERYLVEGPPPLELPL